MTDLRERAGTAPTPVTSKFRPDIQGLRAIAVVIVILDHLFGWPAGGFVGVDVFFVISGYLITTLMLREYRSTGSVSISKFYRRRVRRIIPVSTLVLVATVAVSYFVYFTARFDSIRADAIWSFFFASNWHLAIVGTDYLQSDGPVSPLQHFWSLAVEEQYYVVWPMLLLLLLGAVPRRNQRPTTQRPLRILGFSVVLIVLLSLAWSMWETVNSPVWAYFSTLSRAWEIAVGAAIAIFAKSLSRLPENLRPLVSWMGLAGIVGSVLLINPDSRFPGPWAVLPVVAAAMVIVAGLEGPPRFTGILTNKVSGYIGNISYSLYLVHFPVIIILASVMPNSGVEYYLIAIAVMVVLSLASFHLVEDPVRRSTWLLAYDGSHRQDHRRRSSSRRRHRRLLVLKVVATTVAVGGVLTLVALSLQAKPAVLPAAADTARATAGSDEGRPWDALDQAALSQQIDTALTAPAWPVTSPGIEDATSGRAVEMNRDQNCMNPPSFTDPTMCRWTGGDPQLTAIVVGDSVAIHWLAGIRTVLGARGYTVYGVGLQSCPFATVDITVPDNPVAGTACAEGRPQIADKVRSLDPDLVVISDGEVSIGRLTDGSRGESAQQEWQAGMEDALEAVKSSTTQVVILSPNPAGLSPALCATATSTPADCVSQISDEYQLKSAAESAAAAAVGADYIDVRSWFCDQQGRCPAFVADNLVRYDSTHLTSQYSQHLVPLLDAALKTP